MNSLKILLLENSSLALAILNTGNLQWYKLCLPIVGALKCRKFLECWHNGFSRERGWMTDGERPSTTFLFSPLFLFPTHKDLQSQWGVFEVPEIFPEDQAIIPKSPFTSDLQSNFFFFLVGFKNRTLFLNNEIKLILAQANMPKELSKGLLPLSLEFHVIFLPPMCGHCQVPNYTLDMLWKWTDIPCFMCKFLQLFWIKI